MTTHRKVHQLGGLFFCTFTCYKWLPLFEITKGYELVYNWMRIVQPRGIQFHGYVIMPNHVHLLLSISEGVDLNKLFSNGKRFIAYEIIKRLQRNERESILEKLQIGLRLSDMNRGQKHRVFRTSTDIKECDLNYMAEQKLEYIHANPITGKWNLVEYAEDYIHSSASFYNGRENNYVKLTHLHLAI